MFIKKTIPNIKNIILINSTAALTPSCGEFGATRAYDFDRINSTFKQEGQGVRWGYLLYI